MGKVMLKLLVPVLCGTACLFGAVGLNSSAESLSIGDLNSDGVVDSTDASDILSVYSLLSTGNKSEVDEKKYNVSDVNNDGYIDSTDSSEVLTYYSYVSTGLNRNFSEYMQDMKNIDEVDFSTIDYYSGINVIETYSSDKLHLGLKWDAVEGATGYHVIFRKSDGSDDYVYEKYVSEPRFTALLPEKLSVKAETVDNSGYYYTSNAVNYQSSYTYQIIPYAKYGCFEKVADRYYYGYTNDIRLIVNDAKLTPHRSYPLYNIKADNKFGGVPTKVDIYGNATSANAYTISDADIATLNKFASEHFTPGMTNYEKIECLWHWVNENITYAYGSLYQQVWPVSFVEACLNMKLGQCIQYNGAVCEYMAYLGYDVYMLEMWLNPDNTNQHFRMEVNIDGQAYSIEVGNNNEYAGWMWLFKPIKSSIGK